MVNHRGGLTLGSIAYFIVPLLLLAFFIVHPLLSGERADREKSEWSAVVLTSLLERVKSAEQQQHTLAVKLVKVKWKCHVVTTRTHTFTHTHIHTHSVHMHTEQQHIQHTRTLSMHINMTYL